jgi:hypothetical protein
MRIGKCLHGFGKRDAVFLNVLYFLGQIPLKFHTPDDTISICINPYRGNQDPGIDWGGNVSTGSLLKKKNAEFRLAPFFNEIHGDEEDGIAEPEAVQSRHAA